MSAFFAHAVDAVATYARNVARLPCFPIEPWIERVESYDFEHDTPPSALKLVTTDAIPGAVLPSASDVWWALLPFHDLTKTIPIATKQELIQKRRAFVSLLATLGTSSSPAFRWDAATTDSEEFWTALQYELSPDSTRDTTKAATRQLISLMRAPRPQFLFCVTHDATTCDFADLFEQFLHADSTKDTKALLGACGVTAEREWTVTIDIGLSFTKGKVTHAFLTRLFDIIDQTAKDQRGVRFRVTALRFARECSFQAKAMELLGARPLPASIIDIRIGNVSDLKPGALRLGLNGLVRSPKLRRFGVASPESFQTVASALRCTGSNLETLDVAFAPTVEKAAWLAFGLFHVDSKSHITSLRLRVPPIEKTTEGTDEVTNEWSEAFKRVLQSVTAECELADMEDETESHTTQDRRFVSVCSGTAVKAGPYASTKLLCKIVGENEEMESIASVGAFIAIVVSGLGIGWIPEASVVSERLVRTRLSGVSESMPINRSVTTLIWDRGHSPCQLASTWRSLTPQVNALIELLAIIGEPLTSLHLPHLMITIDELTAILRHCPNLRELNISDHRMASITPLTEAYAQGRCQIETLSLARNDVFVLEGSMIADLNAIFSGPGRRILKQLVVPLLPPSPDWMTSPLLQPERDSVVALGQCIRESETLTFVQMPGAFMCKDVFDRGLAGMTDAFCNGSHRPICVGSMPIRSKLAFLSCLNDETSARNRLDASVVTRIFAFGGLTLARRVLLSVPLALERCACCYWSPQPPHEAPSEELKRLVW